jgi:hypothetical protein
MKMFEIKETSHWSQHLGGYSTNCCKNNMKLRTGGADTQNPANSGRIAFAGATLQ